MLGLLPPLGSHFLAEWKQVGARRVPVVPQSVCASPYADGITHPAPPLTALTSAAPWEPGGRQNPVADTTAALEQLGSILTSVGNPLLVSLHSLPLGLCPPSPPGPPLPPSSSVSICSPVLRSPGGKLSTCCRR